MFVAEKGVPLTFQQTVCASRKLFYANILSISFLGFDYNALWELANLQKIA